MKKLTVFSAALLMAGLALAQTPQDATPAAAQPKTRAAVIAELQQARDSGELAALHGEVGVDVVPVLRAFGKPATALAAKPAATKTAVPAAAGQGRAEAVSELQSAR